jgi:hypothetical protein
MKSTGSRQRDHNAITPLALKVFDAMCLRLTERFGNPRPEDAVRNSPPNQWM